jgi:hypothetical protein
MGSCQKHRRLKISSSVIDGFLPEGTTFRNSKFFPHTKILSPHKNSFSDGRYGARAAGCGIHHGIMAFVRFARFKRRLEERLAEQPRPVRAFFHQFSCFRLDACVLRSHSFFTFKEGVHVLERKVWIFVVPPANRQIKCSSTTEQQYQSWEARIKRKAQAAECQDT